MTKSSSFLKEPTNSTSRWKTKGLVRTAALWAMAIFAAVAFGFVPVSNRLMADRLHYENVLVVQAVDDYGYWFQINGNLVWADFCHDAGIPQFDKGETIKVLNVRDTGACWSYKDTHPAFIMLRDPQGNLIRREN